MYDDNESNELAYSDGESLGCTVVVIVIVVVRPAVPCQTDQLINPLTTHLHPTNRYVYAKLSVYTYAVACQGP